MFLLRTMHIDDHATVTALMQQTPGMSIRDADSRDATQRYLARNPGLSLVAHVGEEMVGCIMCGHDGKRGYLQHLVVLPAYRRQGIGKALVEQCLAALDELGIVKSHVDVLKTNALAHDYWRSAGWMLRDDIDRYSFIRAGSSATA